MIPLALKARALLSVLWKRPKLLLVCAAAGAVIAAVLVHQSQARQIERQERQIALLTGERDAARAHADTQAAAVIECESRRDREAGVCAASLARIDADLRARLERCETRQDRLNAALAPRDGDPDAPPVCLPRRLVPLERVLQH